MERKTDNITVIIVHGDNANTSACACVRNKYMAVLHVNMSVLLGNLTVLFAVLLKKYVEREVVHKQLLLVILPPSGTINSPFPAKT